MRSSESIYMKTKSRPGARILAIIMMAVICAASLPLLGSSGKAEAASLAATGKIIWSNTNLRKAASTSSDSLGTLKKNTKVVIEEEVFISGTSTKKSKRWYKVRTKGKTGYVRADLVKDIKYNTIEAVTSDALNCRKGPATTFKKIGLAKEGSDLTLLLPAIRSGNSQIWYRAKKGNKVVYVCGSYVNYAQAIQVDLNGRTKLAKALLSNPTNGGKVRYVGTFDKNNCTKKIKVTGYGSSVVPQGLAYSGDRYYVLFGMKGSQAIVTYGTDGKRLKASKFSFNMGHPNGITYDPVTGICYIFKGNQKTIYTWNPRTNKFGKSKTPYSSSGIAYDDETKLLYASSHTGIRIYSSDGKFTHQRLFARCKPGISHYIQDCGAGGGFVFHCISGSNKHGANYLDVYRIADNKYLGTIKIGLGETESVIVDNEGYVELLINHSGTHTEYIWKTPLNVKDLK